VLGLGALGVDVDMSDVANYLARRVQDYPGRIEASREALRAFCERHQLDYSSLAARFSLRPVASGGGFGTPISSETNVYGAARSVADYLGPYAPQAESHVGFESREIALSSVPVEIDFSHRGNGPQFLDRGWNKPEAFGVWASDYEASISLPPIRAASGGRLRLEVTGRAPAVSHERRFCYSIGLESAGRLALGEFSADSIRGVTALEVDLDALEAGTAVRLTVRCLELVNPMLVTRGHDNRPLGYGLERLSLALVPVHAVEGVAA
jgi:hypothetical protein